MINSFGFGLSEKVFISLSSSTNVSMRGSPAGHQVFLPKLCRRCPVPSPEPCPKRNLPSFSSLLRCPQRPFSARFKVFSLLLVSSNLIMMCFSSRLSFLEFIKLLGNVGLHFLSIYNNLWSSLFQIFPFTPPLPLLLGTFSSYISDVNTQIRYSHWSRDSLTLGSIFPCTLDHLYCYIVKFTHLLFGHV